MNFTEALIALKFGKKVRRTEWLPNYFIYIKDNKIIDPADYGTVILESNDILNNDWETVDDIKE